MTQPAGRCAYCQIKARYSWSIFQKISPYKPQRNPVFYLISDLFLMNQFLPYGYKVVLYYSLPSEEINMMGILNPMCEAFPRVASCTFHKYGTGGLPTSTYSYKLA